jgi:uncharacterized membrane protein YhaH (DUF805 family)
VDWLGLFLRLDGRIGRRAFWLGFAAVAAVILVTDLLSRWIGVGMVLTLALLYPLVAVVVKRLHDRGRSGWWAALLAAPLGAGVLAAAAARIAGVGEEAIDRAATGGIWAGLVVVIAVLIVELGLRRGKPGYTEHGPPPLV